MREIRFCLDCLLTEEVDVHGRCSTCGSDAVTWPGLMKEFKKQRDASVDECERIFALPAERGGR